MFKPQEHMIAQRGKPYLPVQWRLVWFREQCPQGTINTEMIHLDVEHGFCIFHATITDGKGGSATGTKQESIKDFRDYIEKAETGSIGRALAALGYGTQFVGDEFEEGERIVDAPITPPSAPVVKEPVAPPCKVEVPVEPQPVALTQTDNDAPLPGEDVQVSATKDQKNAIVALCKKIKQEPPRNIRDMTMKEAKDWITILQQKQPKEPVGALNGNRAFSLMR